MQFHGRRGVVDVDTSVTPRIATKKALDIHRHGALRKEAEILKKLSECGITYVPYVLTAGDGWFSYKRIEGDSFDKVFAEQLPAQKNRLIEELIDKAYELDILGIIHGELDRPTSNILVNKECLAKHLPCISMIDFERGYRQDYSGKNLRHIMQWIHRIGLLPLEKCKSRGRYDTETLYHSLKHMHHETKKRTLISALIICILLLGFDQGTKWLFYDLKWGSSLLFLTPVLNTGIGRSLPVPLWITISAAIAIGGGLLFRMKKSNYYPLRAIFLAAGAWGNGRDRILIGGVRDFIDLQYRPVFNFADIYLSIACILLLLSEHVWSSNHSSGNK